MEGEGQRNGENPRFMRGGEEGKSEGREKEA